MNLPSDIETACETWSRCQDLLPAAWAGTLRKVATDPRPLKKEGLNMIRIRILPMVRQPKSFWDPGWSFYEIGVGMFDNNPLILGRVEFFQSPGQVQCGGGFYRNDVADILAKAQGRLPRFQMSADRYLTLSSTYRVNPDKYFPVESAAQDLADLISATLPEFQKLQSCPFGQRST